MTRSTKEFKKARKSAERAIDQTQKAAQHGVAAGRAKLEETGESFEEAIESGYGDVVESLEEMRGEIRSYTRDNIVGSVLVAGVIGFFLGFLVGRK